ncbi:MAG: hypothetical protein QME51_07385 [Planctomycetota bacterium]|nr:hypothetical protein [Planctomycetota bacterium]MDI6788177.1 hypothetical protein [Planctomycetota bacterium]
MRRCKECGKDVPPARKGRTLRGRQLCRLSGYLMSLCPYCYRMRFPERPASNLPSARRGSQKLLSRWERISSERRQFEGMETLLWSPNFYQEWLDYLMAKETGELRG